MLTAEQLQARQHGIGGSDAGAILGLNKYRSPLDVYLEKTGQSEPADLSDNQAIHFGNVLEDVIAQEYARRTGCKVQRRNSTLQHRQHAHLFANIDRWVVGERKGLECKTAGSWVANDWGPSGTDQVPDSYLVQCAHYMAVMDVDAFDLAVLIGGQDFRIYPLRRDPELERAIIDQENTFWFDHVQKGIAPAPRTAQEVAELYPIDTGAQVIATPEIGQILTRAKELKAELKAIEDQLENNETGLLARAKLFMGPASEIVDGEGNKIATWKKAKDSAKTVIDYERIAQILRAHLLELVPAGKMLAERAFIENTKTFTTTGSRRLLLK